MPTFEREISSDANRITGQIIAAAIKIHSQIGPGVLESVYQRCLEYELSKAGLAVQSEVALPVLYDGISFESGYRIDLLVENSIIVELKCVKAILPIHKTQLLTYLRLANLRMGLLLNFNVVHLRNGINRILNNRYQP
jgi:GxxExxY protein